MMARNTLLYSVFGILIYLAVAMAWWGSSSEQTALDRLSQRMHEVENLQRSQTEELKAQRQLIQNQAKQITEITKQLAETKNRNNCEKPDEQPGNLNMTENSPLQKCQSVASSHENTAKGIRAFRATPGMVAFTAYLSHLEELSGPQVVIFDKVMTNEGGAYNEHSGIFTAPIDGVYMFSYFIGQRGIQQLGIDLVLNGQRIAGAVVEGNQPYQDLQGGNLVIKRLRKSDTVWARRRYGTHLEGGIFERTTFSGVLLF